MTQLPELLVIWAAISFNPLNMDGGKYFTEYECQKNKASHEVCVRVETRFFWPKEAKQKGNV